MAASYFGPISIRDIASVALLPPSSHLPSPVLSSAAVAVLGKHFWENGGEVSGDLFEVSRSEDSGSL